ncbi:ABC transporter permease [Hominisplanchenecus murintestinalis]|uniref:ABC transporter permease n=1 Tax=Hominisplanchenecus murintestinalis TaxID=2941517 RepID=UPI00203B1481|nr:ABC transporter permease [Hominisplanchenecus murintestinalis]
MKQFGTILKFELKSYFKNKIFVGVTVFLMLLIAGVMFFPRISAMLEKRDSEIASEQENSAAEIADGQETDNSSGDSVIFVLTDIPEYEDMIHQAFTEAFPDCSVVTAEEDFAWIKEKVAEGLAECAFVIHDLTSYTYYVDNLSMYDFNTETADEILKNLYSINAMSARGISPEEAAEILTSPVSHETESLGKNQAENFFYTYIMIFSLYIVILLYGQMVATNVATEKSSRAMELLITSAKPASMMFGKVIASCLAGLIQLTAVFGSAFLFFNLNKSFWADNTIITSIFDMPLELLAYMLIFFVLGFFIYAFLFGAIGSTASKVEDINTSVMPLTILFVIAFIVVMSSMSSGSVDNTLMLICSYIPFTSPMAMFTRIAMSTVPFYQIALSIGVLVVSVFGIGIFSAKIYRVGVLLYGTTPKIGSILKALKKA